MTNVYDFRLVAISIALAAIASYTALDLALASDSISRLEEQTLMNTSMLATVIGVAILVILGLALLTSFFERLGALQVVRTQALQESEQHFRTLIRDLQVGVLVMGSQAEILVSNQAALDLLGLTEKQLLDQTSFDDGNVIHEDGTNFPKQTQPVQQAIATRAPVRNVVMGIYRPTTAERVWLLVNADPQLATDGSVERVICTLCDITQRQQVETTIQYQAFHDLLTGLPNQTLFNERLKQSLANVRGSQHMMAVMFLDLDRFKTINNTLGHALGDRLLQQFALRLKNCLREGDTVARWGGDEFTMLFPHISGAEEAAKIAQAILAALKPAFHLESHELYINSSIGIALFPLDGEDAQTLLRNADAALHRAKEQGRNKYQFYIPAINSQASELLMLETRLHHSLERGEFVVYYQPQVNIHTGEITGMEALVRWQHPELGLLSPGTFIPLAEENGLIVPIGEWVLRTVCAQNKAWQDAGLLPLRVAVNLSPRQFQQPNLVAVVGQILQDTGLLPHFLELEITESTIMQNVEFASSMLHDLQRMGVHISIDDFGTGYSSLGYLKKFPFHTLKIDQSFVRDLTNDPQDIAIISAVIALGRSLNLRVVAEGVETYEPLELLRRLHCEEIQGYLFSRPLSVEDAPKFLQQYGQKTRFVGLHTPGQNLVDQRF